MNQEQINLNLDYLEECMLSYLRIATMEKEIQNYEDRIYALEELNNYGFEVDEYGVNIYDKKQSLLDSPFIKDFKKTESYDSFYNALVEILRKDISNDFTPHNYKSFEYNYELVARNLFATIEEEILFIDYINQIKNNYIQEISEPLTKEEIVTVLDNSYNFFWSHHKYSYKSLKRTSAKGKHRIAIQHLSGNSFLNILTQTRTEFINKINKKYFSLSNRVLINNETVQLLLGKIAESKTFIQDEKVVLEKLLSLDIIAKKYQNQIAIASFIDYFSTGRCREYEGSDGAYNLYENELRMDRIIIQLDEIIEQLEVIKDRQYAIYNTICMMNSKLDSLSATIDYQMNRMNDSLDNISHNIEEIDARTLTMELNQVISNEINDHISNQLEGIKRNQEFEQLLISDPSVFGGRSIDYISKKSKFY